MRQMIDIKKHELIESEFDNSEEEDMYAYKLTFVCDPGDILFVRGLISYQALHNLAIDADEILNEKKSE